MPNARDSSVSAYERILVVGANGAGKTSQILTLPGKRFVYMFDPAGRASLRQADIDYEEFLPDTLELDATLKGFNKGSQSDRLVAGSKREPSVYMRWVADMNKRDAEGFFKDYDWLCIDSLTLLSNSLMDRQKFINGRYGAIEDLSDFRIVGSKMADLFRSICSMKINLFVTGHLTEYENEKTKRIVTQIRLPGQARDMLPLLFSQIWLLQSATDEKQGYTLLTRADTRGFQAVRTTLQGLPSSIDVTIKDFSRPENYGIGKLLRDAKPRTTSQPAVAQGAAPAPAELTPAPVN